MYKIELRQENGTADYRSAAGAPVFVIGAGYAPHPATTVALATVIEYAAKTYGVASIAQLLHAANSHTSWETLTPAVFGVSADEFERGWHTFLADEYDVRIVPA